MQDKSITRRFLFASWQIKRVSVEPPGFVDVEAARPIYCSTALIAQNKTAWLALVLITSLQSAHRGAAAAEQALT